ncbi:hypothetical protein ACTFIW_012104 [Dictyostelium discoideum]
MSSNRREMLALLMAYQALWWSDTGPINSVRTTLETMPQEESELDWRAYSRILQCKSRPPQPSFRDESQINIKSNQELQLETEEGSVQSNPTSVWSNTDGSHSKKTQKKQEEAEKFLQENSAKKSVQLFENGNLVLKNKELYVSSRKYCRCAYITIAYYHLALIENPAEKVLTMKKAVEQHDVTCRVYISKDGINAQMCFSRADAQKFADWIASKEYYKGVQLKYQGATRQIFPWASLSLYMEKMVEEEPNRLLIYVRNMIMKLAILRDLVAVKKSVVVPKAEAISGCSFPIPPLFDFTKKEWWNDLPIIEEVSIDTAQKRFPGIDLKNEKLPLVAIHATRETEDLSPSGTHGFIDLYITIPEKLGVYNLISPRKYGDSFLPALNQTEFTYIFSPREIGNLIQQIIKSVQMIFSTQKSIYFLVDQNNYISHRYHNEIPLPQLTERQLAITMDFIKDMLISAKEGKMIFQQRNFSLKDPIGIDFEYFFQAKK